MVPHRGWRTTCEHDPAGQSRRRLPRAEDRDRRGGRAGAGVRLVHPGQPRAARSKPSSPPGSALPHVIGCGNGTDAIALALRGLGIGPGSTVVTVSHTAVATVAAIEMAGATPLLIDIDRTTTRWIPTRCAAVLEDPPPGLPPIRAVDRGASVRPAGRPGSDRAAVPRSIGVALIEDCAQAHGARLHGQRVGTLRRRGDVQLLSDEEPRRAGRRRRGGGAPIRALAERIAALRQYGWHKHYISDEVGVNSRLDELQAAILRVKLAHLDAHNARRRAIAASYSAAVEGGPLVAPRIRDGAESVFHLYVARTAQRDAVQARLREAGIGSGIDYPVPVHLQPAYAGRVATGAGGCPATEAASREILSLPLYPELSNEQVRAVCAGLRGL